MQELSEATRFNTYCEKYFKEIPSRKGIKKAIQRGELLLNGEQVDGGLWLKNGDIITWVESNRKPPKVYPIDLEVVYEDDFLAVINKPPGISVSGNQYQTIYNALGYNLKPSTQKDTLPWPLPAHRLDNPTRGLLIIAKTTSARIQLGADFEQKRIQKTYHALVIGKPPSIGQVSAPIDHKKAETQFERIETIPACKGDFLSLLQLYPITGRTHQLRIHCATIGTPILGDKKYGKEGLILQNKGLFLASTAVDFPHPISREKIHLDIGIPEKFSKRLAYEKRRISFKESS